MLHFQNWLICFNLVWQAPISVMNAAKYLCFSSLPAFAIIALRHQTAMKIKQWFWYCLDTKQQTIPSILLQIAALIRFWSETDTGTRINLCFCNLITQLGGLKLRTVRRLSVQRVSLRVKSFFFSMQKYILRVVSEQNTTGMAWGNTITFKSLSQKQKWRSMLFENLLSFRYAKLPVPWFDR